MRMRAAVVAVAATGFLTSATWWRTSAQTATPALAADPAQGSRNASTASLDGVVEGSDQKPIARARVVLRSQEHQESRALLTDAHGAFSFRRLPPGQYTVFVARTGYTLPYASGGPVRGMAVQLKERETRTGVRIPLQRAGTVVGRVLDEDGTPLAGAEIEAVSLRSAEVEERVGAARSDDRGDFRLGALPPGQYLVLARDLAFTSIVDESGPLRYSPTYFPGVLSSSEAQPVTIAEGEESRRIEFRVRIVRAARLSGAIVPPERERFLNGAALLVPREATSPAPLPSGDVDFLPDGRFAFRNVPAGKYHIRVRAETNARQPMLFGSYAVDVDQRDIAGISVVLAPGPIVEGRVEWQAAPSRSAPIAKGLRVRAPLADGSSLGDSLTGDVHADGSFRIRGVMPGSHFIVLEGLSDAWTVTAVLFRGKNFLNRPVDIPSGGRIQGLRVIVAATSGASPGVSVTVLPKDVRKQDLIETHAAVLTRAIVR